MTGIELIAAERERQVKVHHWTPAHDDEHDKQELAKAAACYLLRDTGVTHKPRWPWSRHWWKPSVDPIRNLVKAGALIAAEIDRLQRQAAVPASDGHAR